MPAPTLPYADPEQLYYRYSGRTGPAGPLAAAAAGLPAALLCGVAYALVVRYVPFVKLMFLACLAFGAGLGALTTVILRKFKVRSLPVALAVTAAVTFAGYYVSWATWLTTLVDTRDPMHLALALLPRPDRLLRFIQVVNTHGTWALSREDKDPVSGLPLTAIWLAEAAAIFGCALLITKNLLTTTLFCETCNQWLPKGTSLAATGDSPEPKDLKAHLELKNFPHLLTLGPANPSKGAYLTLTHHHCPTCNQLHTLTVTRVTTKIDKKRGPIKSGETILLHRLLLTPQDVTTLQSLAAAPTTPQPPAPPPAPTS